MVLHLRAGVPHSGTRTSEQVTVRHGRSKSYPAGLGILLLLVYIILVATTYQLIEELLYRVKAFTHLQDTVH
jgi:hypothetical protein